MGDNIQPWCTPFPIWNQSAVPCPGLTVASWPAYRFLKRQVKWSDIPISFRIFHGLLWSTVKGFGIVHKEEIDVFLELSCFFNDSVDVGNLISGSSAYAEHIMRNPGLEEAQAGIKIAGRNINNLGYSDDTTFRAESEEELKSLLMKVEEESEKDGLKFNIQKTKIMASGSITSWEKDGKEWKQCQT